MITTNKGAMNAKDKTPESWLKKSRMETTFVLVIENAEHIQT